MNDWLKWQDAEPADFAVIGDPIGHSLSPRMHHAAYRAAGLAYKYTAVKVPQGEVARAFVYLASLGYRGLNVTVPHKEEAFHALKSVEPFAQLVQAVNTVRLAGLSGTNTDGDGFLDTLKELAISAPAKVLVLGAGGSAVAIVAALIEAGFDLRLCNRTKARAEALVDRIKAKVEIQDEPDPTDCDLIVNTTSASLQVVQLPIDWAKAKTDAVAYELVYGAEPTLFMRAAAERGLRTVDGLALLVAQGARSFEWWLGMDAPRQAMLESLQW